MQIVISDAGSSTGAAGSFAADAFLGGTSDYGRLHIVKAWYGHNSPSMRYQCGDQKGKDVTSIVRGMVNNNELHLNPGRRGQYLNDTFQFGKSWAHCKVVAVKYHYGDGMVREIVTAAKSNETVGVDIIPPSDLQVESQGLGRLCIIQAWYGHNSPSMRYQCGHQKGKDVTSIVRGMVRNNELHLNPDRRGQYLNDTFQFGKSWGHCKVVAVKYHFGDGNVKEIVTAAKPNETVGVDIVVPADFASAQRNEMLSSSSTKGQMEMAIRNSQPTTLGGPGSVEEAPPAYGVYADDDGVAPSAPAMTESFNEAPPGYDGAEGGGTGPGAGPGAQRADEVGAWLRRVGEMYYTEYHVLFVRNGFDSMDMVRTLTESDLQTVIGVNKLGHRRKLMMEIRR